MLGQELDDLQVRMLVLGTADQAEDEARPVGDGRVAVLDGDVSGHALGLQGARAADVAVGPAFELAPLSETLDDDELNRVFEWEATDGRRYRWDVEGVLTQVFGHAWYHRGQIAQLVAALGGKAVDTDYIFWSRLTAIEPSAAGKE